MMKVFLSEDDEGNIVVEMLFTSGDTRGDARSVVEPGGSFMSVGFDELQKMGSGEHEIDF